jgi:hypothetical protein
MTLDRRRRYAGDSAQARTAALFASLLRQAEKVPLRSRQRSESKSQWGSRKKKRIGNSQPRMEIWKAVISGRRG